MPKKIKLEGEIFNNILVIERSDSYSVNKKLKCICHCGNEFETTLQRLKNGWTKSCGCMTSQLLKEKLTTHGAASGGQNTPEYQSYIAMIHRCYNDRRVSWKNYGGRGIIVSEESWLEKSPKGFINFLNDMGKRPKGTSLDRIDTNSNYCVENCRWASRRLQAVNRDVKKTSKNTSKYRGVSLRKSKGTWMVRIGSGVTGKYIWIGEYETEEEAARAYDKKAIEIHGPNAKLNFIE